MLKKSKGPAFLRYAVPILDTLKELGSSGNAGEVVDRVIERCKVSEKEQQETTSNGQSRVRNQIAWARFYLAKAGLLGASRRGLWNLTPAGRAAKLDADGVLALFKKAQRSSLGRRQTPPMRLTQTRPRRRRKNPRDRDDGLGVAPLSHGPPAYRSAGLNGRSAASICTSGSGPWSSQPPLRPAAHAPPLRRDHGRLQERVR